MARCNDWGWLARVSRAGTWLLAFSSQLEAAMLPACRRIWTKSAFHGFPPDGYASATKKTIAVAPCFAYSGLTDCAGASHVVPIWIPAEIFIRAPKLTSLLPEGNTTTQPSRQADKDICPTFFKVAALSRSDVVCVVETNRAGLSC